MKNQLKEFTYKKAGGDISERKVWILNTPSDCFFGLDLSQFDKDEQDFLVIELERITQVFNDELVELGMATCFRQFKEERIIAQ